MELRVGKPQSCPRSSISAELPGNQVIAIGTSPVTGARQPSGSHPPRTSSERAERTVLRLLRGPPPDRRSCSSRRRGVPAWGIEAKNVAEGPGAIHPGMPGSVSVLSDSVRTGMIRRSEVNGHQSEVSGEVSMPSDSLRAGMIRTSEISGHPSEVSGAVPVLSDSVRAAMVGTSGVSGSAYGLSGPASGGRGSESTRSGSAEAHWPLPEFSVSPAGRPWRLRLARSALRSTSSAIASLASSVELVTAPRSNGTRLASA